MPLLNGLQQKTLIYLLALIQKKKGEVADLEDHLERLQSSAEDDKERFLEFAWDFIDNAGSKFFEISKENQLRCKNLIFPAGFVIDKNKIVYTPEVSVLYSLASNKKDLSDKEKSLLVPLMRFVSNTCSPGLTLLLF